MSTLLTKRRAVDLCRVATCLCPLAWRRGGPSWVCLPAAGRCACSFSGWPSSAPSHAC